MIEGEKGDAGSSFAFTGNFAVDKGTEGLFAALESRGKY